MSGYPPNILNLFKENLEFQTQTQLTVHVKYLIFLQFPLQNRQIIVKSENNLMNSYAKKDDVI